MPRLGILGTFVWDTIWTVDDLAAGRPFSGWGGVAYSLAAASAAAPRGWEVVPVVKVGADLAEEARGFVRGLPGVRDDSLVVVPETNNRVELRYTDEARRGERLTGGVPAWEAEELRAAVDGLDALYVNFLSGFEMGLETAEALRAGFRGPLYADLHSLFLGCPGAGVRAMRRLPEWERWVRCFDAVQVNEEELRMLLGAPADAEEGAERVAREGAGLVLVTRGPEGASWARRAGERIERGTVAPQRRISGGDPTGAGDVWGATLFCARVEGAPLADALGRAHAAAARKLSHRGAAGLRDHLAG